MNRRATDDRYDFHAAPNSGLVVKIIDDDTNDELPLIGWAVREAGDHNVGRETQVEPVFLYDGEIWDGLAWRRSHNPLRLYVSQL